MIQVPGRLVGGAAVAALALLVLRPAPAAAQGGVARSAAERAAEARVEAGDRIVIKVAREPLLSDTVMVSAKGEIAVGKIGTIAASSLPIRVLEDTLRARYARFLRNPAVELVVLRRIAVNGEVAKPDVYYLDVSATLRDAIATAGGITEIGDDSRVSIVRRGERIRVPRWQEDVSLASDLHSGDEVLVGKRSWLSRNALSVASTSILLTSVILSAVRR